MTQILSKSGWIPSADTVWPRNCSCFMKNSHLDSFSLSPAAASLWNTSSKCCRCSSRVLLKTMTSSRYVNTDTYSSPWRTLFIRSWNIEGALHNPNGILLNPNSPIWVRNVVLGRDSSLILICQKPDLRSILEKYLAPPKDASTSSIWGSG